MKTRVIEKMDRFVDLAANSRLLILLVIIATDLSVLLNIPFLRQILGFAFLSFIPGLLILYLLKLNKLDIPTKFVLSVGCSISFLMFYGLLVNNLALSLDYETPLSTIPLLIALNIPFIVLAIIGCRTNKELAISLRNHNLTRMEKAFLIVAILFPALSIFGMHVMNTTDNNIILMFMLFLIPIYVAFVGIFNQKIPNRLYPVMIFFISISILLLMSLRSNYIMGLDAHHEFYIFQLTVTNHHWQIFEKNVLNSCLAISLLPAIYQSILGVDAEYLFKVLFSVLFSISPLIVYIISKKYIGSFYGFLAAFFFISVSGFALTPLWARINMAIMFFGLGLMVIFHPDINDFRKKVLFITFLATVMVSHYSTAYILFFVLLGAVIGMQVLHTVTNYHGKSSRYKSFISISTVILFFCMFFFWYSQITEATFNKGVDFLAESFTQMHEFFVLESRGTAIEGALGKSETLRTQISAKIEFAFTWATIAFIAIGVFATLKKRESILQDSGHDEQKPSNKIDAEYFVISVVFCCVIVMSMIIPYVSIGYGMERLYFTAMVPLSLFFVLGSMAIAKYAKLKPHWILIIVLIPYFLCTIGAMDQVFDIPEAVILNSEGVLYNNWFIGDRESYGAKWLGDNRDGRKWINSDPIAGRRLISQAGIRYLKRYSIFGGGAEIRDGYHYLRPKNLIDCKLTSSNFTCDDVTEYPDIFIGKAKIYGNGGSEVWL